MQSGLSKSHNLRSVVVCFIVSFLLFLLASVQTLTSVATRLPQNTEVWTLTFELGAITTAVVSLIAIPLGYIYMLFFGGVLSTRAIKLYLYLTRGKTVITSKSVDLEAIQRERGFNLKLRRQLVYFAFILAVVLSFAIYISKHGGLPIASPVSKTSDAISLISQHYITYTMLGSLMIPVVALALPYFGGLRLRTIDVGPFHTTILTFVVGASGGFTFLYSILARPDLGILRYYLVLLVGVCWCFAFGCSLAADPANRRIVRHILAEKTGSKLVSCKIWLENPPGKFVEV